MQRQQSESFPHGAPQSGVAERCRRSGKALFRAAASHLSAPFGLRFRKPLKKEWTEKIGVVSISTVGLALPQFGPQIVRVVVQEILSSG